MNALSSGKSSKQKPLARKYDHRPRRNGGIVILLLIVLLVVGTLTHQAVRTLWLLRKNQDQQARIAQARELLEVGKQYDKSFAELVSSRQEVGLTFVVPVGQEYGRLALVPAGNTSPEGNSSSLWVAKFPVNAQGEELSGSVTIVVSCERQAK